MRVWNAYRALFSDKRFFRLFLPVAIPIALQTLVSSGTALGAGLLVGQLGDDAIAGVSLAGQVQFVLFIAAFGIASGSSVFTSQYWGRKDHAGVAHTQGVSLVLSLALGSVFAIAGGLFPETLLGWFTPDQGVIAEGARYLRISAWSFPLTALGMSYSLVLRAVGDTKTPLAFAGVGLAVQLVTAVVLIFGVGVAPMGTVGAGIAVLAAKLAEVGGMIIAVQVRGRPNAGLARLFTFDRAFLVRYLKIALPVVLNEAFWAVGMAGIKAIYGWMGAVPLAAVAILDTFGQLVYIVLAGTGNAAGILIGHAIGRGHLDDARHFGRNVALLAPVVGIVTAVPLLIGAPFLPLIFQVSDDVRGLATALIWVFCVLLPGKAYYHDMIVGVLRGGGDVGFSLIMDLSGIWLWALPLGWLMAFVLHWPFLVVFFLINIEEPLKATLALWRMKTGKWIHRVTEAKQES
jgi:putative MATE family efflux protein